MEGFELFDQMLYKIDNDISTYLLKAEIRQNTKAEQTLKGKAVENSNKVKKRSPKRVNKIGRNEPCPCGSGKKYKQCCGK
jgi:preprotein translocase subunit SecA